MQFEAGDVIGWRHISGPGLLQGSFVLSGGVLAARTSSLASILTNNKQAWDFGTTGHQPWIYSITAVIRAVGGGETLK